MSGPNDVKADERPKEPTAKEQVSAKVLAARLKQEAHTLSPKERLSAYFTIAAAAFGLISDGCKLVSGFDSTPKRLLITP